MARKPHIFAGLVRVDIVAFTPCKREVWVYIGSFPESAIDAITDGLDTVGIAESALGDHTWHRIDLCTVRLGARGQPLMRTFDIPYSYGGDRRPADSAPAWSQEVAGNA